MGRSRLEAFVGSEDQRHPKRQNSELYLKYAKKPYHIISLLYWTGLLEDSDKNTRKRVIARIFPVLLILLTVDTIVNYQLQPGVNFFRILIYSCNYIINVPIWFAMRRRRKQLKAILRLCHKIQPQTMTWKVSATLYGICISSVISSVLIASSRYKKEFATGMAYGYVINNVYAQVVLIFTKNVLYNIIIPLSPTLAAFLLCLFCQRICDQVRSLRFLIEKRSPEQFTVSFQSNILSHMLRIHEALFFLQRVFYFSSFLICAANFYNCCLLVSWFLQSYDKSVELVLILFAFFGFFVSVASLFACLWIAGGLPVELEAFNKQFQKKTQLRLIVNGKVDEIDFEKHLSGRPVFVLTGCDIIHFTRCAILALAGAILTYTLLMAKI